MNHALVIEGLNLSRIPGIATRNGVIKFNGVTNEFYIGRQCL